MGTHSVSLVRRFMVISLLLALVLGAAGAIPALAAMIMTAATVDNSASDVGQYSSMVLSSSGNPIISYYDVTNDDLKLVEPAQQVFDVRRFAGAAHREVAHRNDRQIEAHAAQQSNAVQKVAQGNAESVKECQRQQKNSDQDIVGHGAVNN